jgi:hypothetical protein
MAAAATKDPKKPKRVVVFFHDPAMLKRIDEWATKNRRHTRSNAIEALLAEALDAAKRVG